MADKCEQCVTGMIGTTPVYVGGWTEANAVFDRVIDDWNEKTKRFAVPHPGYARKFNYCPRCGRKVEGE